MASLDRKQTDLQSPSAGRKMRVEVGELPIEREGPLAASRDHPDERVPVQANHVGVLALKAIDEPARRIRRMLWNLLDESTVVQPIDGFELPIFGDQLECQRRSPGHLPVSAGRRPISLRTSPRLASSATTPRAPSPLVTKTPSPFGRAT